MLESSLPRPPSPGSQDLNNQSNPFSPLAHWSYREDSWEPIGSSHMQDRTSLMISGIGLCSEVQQVLHNQGLVGGSSHQERGLQEIRRSVWAPGLLPSEKPIIQAPRPPAFKSSSLGPWPSPCPYVPECPDVYIFEASQLRHTLPSVAPEPQTGAGA